MQMIDLLLGRIALLLVVVAAAIVVVQHYAEIVSLLIGALIFLAVAKLLWPLPRR